MNTITNAFRHRILITVLLFLIGIFFSLRSIFPPGNAFTVLTYTRYPSIAKYSLDREILKHKKIDITFQAQEDYLGIVQLHINTFDRWNTDTIVFRIKEQDAKGWYYQNSYDTAQTTNLAFYPFGFPALKNSKDKLYEIEIESLDGVHGNAIGISSIQPIVVTKYQYPKQLLLTDRSQLRYFIGLKIQNLIQTINPIIDVLIFFLPFLYYVIWVWSKKNYASFVLIFFVIIVYDVFFFNSPRETNYFFLLSLWIWLSIVNKFSNKISLIFTILFLALSLMFSINGSRHFIEELSVWAYMFLVAAVITGLYETAISSKTISAANFLMTAKSSPIYQLPLYAIALVFWGITDIAASSALIMLGLKKFAIFIVKKFGIVPFLFVSISSLIILTLSLIFGIQITIKLGNKIKAEQLKQLRLSLNPIITGAEPGIVYHSTKIILYGNGFDPRSDRSSLVKLVGTHGQVENVNTDYVDNSKIIFTVPLHWNTGLLHFWVDVPFTWRGKQIIAESNVVAIKLISTLNPNSPDFSPDDDAFFRQLKTLTPEVRQINGYE